MVTFIYPSLLWLVMALIRLYEFLPGNHPPEELKSFLRHCQKTSNWSLDIVADAKSPLIVPDPHHNIGGVLSESRVQLDYMAGDLGFAELAEKLFYARDDVTCSNLLTSRYVRQDPLADIVRLLRERAQFCAQEFYHLQTQAGEKQGFLVRSYLSLHPLSDDRYAWGMPKTSLDFEPQKEKPIAVRFLQRA